MNNPPPNPNQWKRLLDVWPRLHPWQRKALLARAHWSLITDYWSLPFPIIFSLRATLAIFALLIILPLHPLSMPTAAGGGLAFTLITYSRRKINYEQKPSYIH